MSRSTRKWTELGGVALEPMTPDVAASLTVPESLVDAPALRPAMLAAASAASAAGVDLESGRLDNRGSSALLSREALRRRLLGVADVTSAALAAGLVLGAFGQRRAAFSALVGAALVLVVFKLAGLYDRDDLRLVHSTLDDVPQLAQLTGLFALGVAILQNFVLRRSVSADQIAALWAVSLGAIVVARILARALAARSLPAERCLVIGDRARTQHIREKLASSRARAEVIAALPLEGRDIDEIDWVDTHELIVDLVRNLNVHRIIIAPTSTDTGCGRPDSRCEGGGREGQRATAHVRGCRLSGRV